jgi:hypothetical protein
MKSHKYPPLNMTTNINPSHNPTIQELNKPNNHGQISVSNKSKENTKHHHIAKSFPIMDYSTKIDKYTPNRKITHSHPTATHSETPWPPPTPQKNSPVPHPSQPSHPNNKTTHLNSPPTNNSPNKNNIPIT